MKIAILGGGNMGGAIALGAIGSGLVKDTDVTVTYPLDYLVEKFAEQGYKCLMIDDNVAAVEDADMIVVAVKPWMMEQVLGEIKYTVTENQLIVSIVAGVTFQQIAGFLYNKERSMPPLFRVIPNTAIALGQSMTFISSKGADDMQERFVDDLFIAMGRTMIVEESQMTAVTALASCGIAYAYKYIDAAVKGGIEMGIGSEESLRIVLQTVKGALMMLENNGTEPQTEIDKVTTPGGITLKGLEAMERRGFSEAVIEGLKASR